MIKEWMEGLVEEGAEFESAIPTSWALLEEEHLLQGRRGVDGAVPNTADTLHVDEEIARGDFQEDGLEDLGDREGSFLR